MQFIKDKKEFLKLIGEAVVIASLLLTNVVMGNFTKSYQEETPEWTIMDRVVDALSIQNICIALVAGFVASFFLWNVIRQND